MSIDNFVQEERVATKLSRDFFMELARTGKISMKTMIEFSTAACKRIDKLEAQPAPEPKPRPPCQCAACQGYHGWFATCIGYTP